MSVSVKSMSDYFTDMAKGKITKNDIHVMGNQKGKGIGSSRKSRAVYPISKSKITTISPVQQSIEQAKSNIKDELRMRKGIKRPRSKSSVISSPRKKRRKTSQKKKKRHPIKKKKTQKKKKQKKKKRTVKRKKATPRRKINRKKKDIFQ